MIRYLRSPVPIDMKAQKWCNYHPDSFINIQAVKFLATLSNPFTITRTVVPIVLSTCAVYLAVSIHLEDSCPLFSSLVESQLLTHGRYLLHPMHTYIPWTEWFQKCVSSSVSHLLFQRYTSHILLIQTQYFPQCHF